MAPVESRSQPVTRRARFLIGVAPPLVTLIITLVGITGSSYWRDEAATMTAVKRSFGELLRMLRQVDADHGAYYIIMWLIVRVGGTGALATRLPSVLAMVAAAALVTAIGCRIASPLTGLAAGLVFAVMPSTSFYAQNARPDALSVALAAGATYLLVRILQADGTARRWFLGYAACMAALGLIDILGLFLIFGHAATVVLAARRRTDDAAKRHGTDHAAHRHSADRTADWAVVRGWLLSVVAATAVASPVVLASFRQRASVSWIVPPGFWMLKQFPTILSPVPHPLRYYAPFAVGILACVVIGLLVSVAGGRARLRERWPRDLVAITLPWLILPGLVLVLISVVKPLYFSRYILFCVPAIALLTGAALAALGRVAAAAVLVAVLLLGLPAQQAIRQPAGHGENIRYADQIVARHMRRGDGVIFHNYTEESLTYAYSFGFADLRNISQAQTPAQSGTLTGTSAPTWLMRQRAAGLSRVWIVDIRHFTPPHTGLAGLGFRFVHRWRIGDIRMYLYVHSSRR